MQLGMSANLVLHVNLKKGPFSFEEATDESISSRGMDELDPAEPKLAWSNDRCCRAVSMVNDGHEFRAERMNSRLIGRSLSHYRYMARMTSS